MSSNNFTRIYYTVPHDPYSKYMPPKRTASNPTEIGIFIFHRDFRVEDNRGLEALTTICPRIVPLFLFDDRQVIPAKNPYFSSHGFDFLMDSLADLMTFQDVPLHCMKGVPTRALSVLLTRLTEQNYRVTAVGWNRDMTPFALQRDAEIRIWCESESLQVVETEDYTLLPIGTLRPKTKDATMYKKFTPFHTAAQAHAPPPPRPSTGLHAKLSTRWVTVYPASKVSRVSRGNDLDTTLEDQWDSVTRATKTSASASPLRHPEQLTGGRKHALAILKRIQDKEYTQYSADRDTPSAKGGSTRLSAYLKFGCISIREAYYTIADTHGSHHDLLRQLWWREFYYNIAVGCPHVFGHSFQTNPALDSDRIPWENNEDWFRRWCEGQTGVPIIDAGMRQLNQTGYMHNRLRMMVSMFLTKDLLIDWRWGERYFATQLCDYDPAQNNGGWQWSASTGVDSQPYFRIFNPWTMAKRVDPACEYIYKWVPELRSLPPSVIAKWDTESKRYATSEIGYPCPLVDHAMQRDKAIAMYRM